MATDATVSAGGIASGIAIIFIGWYWLDSVMSLFVVAAVIFVTWGLLRVPCN